MGDEASVGRSEVRGQRQAGQRTILTVQRPPGLFGLKETEGFGSRLDREAASDRLTSSGKVNALCWRHLDRDATDGAELREAIMAHFEKSY